MASPASFCFPVLNLLFHVHDYNHALSRPPRLGRISPHSLEVGLLQRLSGIMNHHHPSSPPPLGLRACVCTHVICGLRGPLSLSFSSSRSLFVSVAVPLVAVSLSTSSALRRPSVSGSVPPFALTHRERSCQQPPVYATPCRLAPKFIPLSSLVLVLVTCNKVFHSFSLFSFTH